MTALAASVLVVLAAAAGRRALRRRRILARLTTPPPVLAAGSGVHTPDPAAEARGGGTAGHSNRPPAAALAAAAVGVAMAAATAGPAAAAALAAAPLVLHVAVQARRRAAGHHRREAQLPLALEQLAASLRSGASLPVALDDVGRAADPPIGPELADLARAAAHGRPLRRVLDEWAVAHGDAGTRLAATALVLATVVGAAPARAIDGVAATVRERLDLAAERRALATQARTSALVLSVAPAGFAVVLVATDTAAGRFLVGTPAGLLCLVAGIALDAAGAWWMARLTGPQAA
ncbi:MAG TPA: type II secretion system F family protein [Acidimicrobiales bacterium]